MNIYAYATIGCHTLIVMTCDNKVMRYAINGIDGIDARTLLSHRDTEEQSAESYPSFESATVAYCNALIEESKHELDAMG